MREVFRVIGTLTLAASFAATTSGMVPPRSEGASNPYPHTEFVSGDCDPNLWKHVYQPGRLQVIKPCKTVSGTIRRIEPKPDGDYHVLLELDPAHFDITLNPRFRGNKIYQNGFLVTEPICAVPTTDEGILREGVCVDFSQKFDIWEGEHVVMKGSLVVDKNEDHEDGAEWLEIHPISSIRKD